MCKVSTQVPVRCELEISNRLIDTRKQQSAEIFTIKMTRYDQEYA